MNEWTMPPSNGEAMFHRFDHQPLAVDAFKRPPITISTNWLNFQKPHSRITVFAFGQLK
jgi:hypothetical protein